MTRGRANTGDQPKGLADALAHNVQFALPCAALRPYLAGFHSYDIRCHPGDRFEEIFFPAWVNIRFEISGESWAMRIADKRFDPIPKASLFGPTGHAGFAEFSQGHMFGVGVTPRGWARLFGGDVSAITDHIVSLETILGDEAAALHQRILDAGEFEGQVAILEQYLLDRLAAHPEEPTEIATIQVLLMDPAIANIEEAAARAGMPSWQFARICRRAFGFPPKRLLRRARFMRTLMALREPGAGPWPELLDIAYSDQSHFIRDCQDFIGMPPGQFLARSQPVAATSMAERTRILGAPAQALHRDAQEPQDG